MWVNPLILFMLTVLFFSCKTVEKQLLINHAKNYQPLEENRKALIKYVEESDKDFDPAYNALQENKSAESNHYHSTMTGLIHPTRDAAGYAVDLLETGVPKYQERAFKVLEAVIAAQDTITTSETYGIWPYFFEEPLAQMNKPDWNWADFIGVKLLEAYMKYNKVFPKDLKSKLERSIIHAARSIEKRDVKPGYTNIAIMGTLVTHLTAHLFNMPDLKDYADMRMKRFYDYTKKLGGFEEYNSPNYTVVALDELVRMKQYILDPETLEMVNYCYDTAWKVLATHFHPPTGQLAGPHSRSYSTLLRSSFYDILYGASDGKIKIGDAKKPMGYYKLQHHIPQNLVHYFLDTPDGRVQKDTFSLNENPPLGYTWLAPDFCFGTVSRSTTWQQRRPYVAYWGDKEDTRYLRVRLLHDFEDFGIGNIFSVQEKGEALTAMNFATNGGDYHISIDRLKEGRFNAKDVRLRFEMASNKLYDKISFDDKGLTVKDEDTQVTINMLKAVFGDAKIKAEKGHDDKLAWVDYVIYKGDEKNFDLNAVNKACFVWQTVIGSANAPVAASKPKITEKGNRLEARTAKMAISIPVKPALEDELQDAFSYEVSNGK